MSLFKVREFWSFDLNQLASQYSAACRGDSVGAASESDTTDAASISTDQPHVNHSLGQQQQQQQEHGEPKTSVETNSIKEGSFIISLGRFHSIGQYDVFVAANLEGFICVIQVPDVEQEKRTLTGTNSSPKESQQYSSTDRDGANSDGAKVNENTHNNRQLLAAKYLGFPIVDLKCCFANSTMKQSIVVLSFDKLVIYEVKRHQLDLMTTSFEGDTIQTTGGVFIKPFISQDLFSHELEEYHRFNLLPQELAMSLVISENNCDSNATQRESLARVTTNRQLHGDSNKRKSVTSKQVTDSSQQLPQRDVIVVQYSNQSLFTLVDNKKLVGHYQMVSTPSGKLEIDSQIKDSSSRIEKLAQFMGPMPMAFLHEARAQLLTVSTSDRRAYCLPLNKLFAQAQQSVMKRVAQNLMLDSKSNVDQIKTTHEPAAIKTELDLSSMADWCIELVSEPIQFVAIQRKLAKGSASLGETQVQSQLFVVSRYNLDLFSSFGQHLWSQRLETSINCTHSYLMTTVDSSSNISNALTDKRIPELHRGSSATNDSLLSLVCADCLSNEKSNLLIFQEDQIVWSALLSSKPIQLFRANLSKMSGVLAALDLKQTQLSICYLGTNVDLSDEDMLLGEQEKEESQISQFDNLDEPLFAEDENDVELSGESQNMSNKNNGQNGFHGDTKSRLLLTHVRLEALDRWPSVSVNCYITLKMDTTLCAGLLQNVVATLEFDDLISFEPDAPAEPIALSDGVMQFHLGNCWPDRREPMKISGRFHMRSTNLARNCTINDQIINSNKQQVFVNFNPSSDHVTLPKTLRVNMYLSFNENHSDSSIQEESFLLPLNMIAQLLHIDYSNGSNQTLDDVQANLNPLYKRELTSLSSKREVETKTFNSNLSTDKEFCSSTISSPYYLCDLYVRTKSDVVELMDELIEADLVCRGLFDEASLTATSQGKNRIDKRLNTLENINLLAHSLDCRLKYKGQKIQKDQSNNEESAVLMSIALKVPCGDNIIKSGLKSMNLMSEEDGKTDKFSVVWLHLLDLSAIDETILPEEMIKQHLKEWKALHLEAPVSILERYENLDTQSEEPNCPVLITIECDYAAPVLLLQSHLIERIRKRVLIQSDYSVILNPISETDHNSIEISTQNIFRLNDFIAISVNLHDFLSSAVRNYELNFKEKLRSLKEELNREFAKFQATTNASLSFAKRLSSLPASKQEEFQHLTHLTNHYQLNLNRLLSKLEKLKFLDYNYSKLPKADEIVLENGFVGGEMIKKLIHWPEFSLVIN